MLNTIQFWSQDTSWWISWKLFACNHNKGLNFFNYNLIPDQCQNEESFLRINELMDSDIKVSDWARMKRLKYYNAVIMNVLVSQITRLTIVYSAIYSGADQRKHQSSISLALCGEFTNDWWIPRTRASNAEIVFIWWCHHDRSSFQGLFQESSFSCNSNFMEISFSFHLNSIEWIPKKFCKAVMPCVKLYFNIFSTNQAADNWNVHRIWIMKEKSLTVFFAGTFMWWLCSWFYFCILFLGGYFLQSKQ